MVTDTALPRPNPESGGVGTHETHQSNRHGLRKHATPRRKSNAALPRISARLFSPGPRKLILIVFHICTRKSNAALPRISARLFSPRGYPVSSGSSSRYPRLRTAPVRVGGETSSSWSSWSSNPSRACSRPSRTGTHRAARTHRGRAARRPAARRRPPRARGGTRRARAAQVATTRRPRRPPVHRRRVGARLRLRGAQPPQMLPVYQAKATVQAQKRVAVSGRSPEKRVPTVKSVQCVHLAKRA